MAISLFDTGDKVKIKLNNDKSMEARVILPVLDDATNRFFYFLEDPTGRVTLKNRKFGKIFPEGKLELVLRAPSNEYEYKMLDELFNGSRIEKKSKLGTRLRRRRRF